ncbi:hypothetical protein FACS18949_06150 [Clostridia bacterium]|nr:hypothetical protein FACS18949_06150 [Clostridia bacterium]
MANDNSAMQEDIFDALLRVSFKEYARREAEAIPPEDEMAEPSPEFKVRMRKVIRKYKRSERLKKVGRFSSRVAAVIIVIMALGFTATMSFASVRTQFFNTLIEIGDEYLGFNFAPISTATPSDGVALTPSYLPDGFSEVSSKIIDKKVTIRYSNDGEDKIGFDALRKSEGATLQIDNEYDFSFVVEANGIMFTVYDGQSKGHGVTVVGEDDYFLYDIYSGTVPSDELVKIAESLRE